MRPKIIELRDFENLGVLVFILIPMCTRKRPLSILPCLAAPPAAAGWRPRFIRVGFAAARADPRRYIIDGQAQMAAFK